jgi:hypothetical protein
MEIPGSVNMQFRFCENIRALGDMPIFACLAVVLFNDPICPPTNSYFSHHKTPSPSRRAGGYQSFFTFRSSTL